MWMVATISLQYTARFRFQLIRETLCTYGSSVQRAENYTGRSTVLGVQARQRRYSTHTGKSNPTPTPQFQLVGLLMLVIIVF